MKIKKLRQFMGEEKWKEYQRLRNNEKTVSWRKRNCNKVVRWRQKLKKKMIEFMGGKCTQCGYDKDCPPAYAFHHLDKSKKEFSISKGVKSLEGVKEELKKCILVCVRCHAEIHDKEYEMIRQTTILDYDRKVELVKKAKENFLLETVGHTNKVRNCKFCKKTFSPKCNTMIYCSISCTSMVRRKVERPSAEELIILIKSSSYLAVGKHFKVSDNAVRKWVIDYGYDPKTLEKLTGD